MTHLYGSRLFGNWTGTGTVAPMDTTTPAPPLPDEATLPEQRACTRCDGTQHLVSTVHGMGKYRCDSCELVVGFDLESDPREFLLDRGQPGAYTREVYGPRLAGSEQRL